MAPGWSPEGWNGETTSKSATTREYREGVSGSAGGAGRVRRGCKPGVLATGRILPGTPGLRWGNGDGLLLHGSLRQVRGGQGRLPRLVFMSPGNGHQREAPHHRPPAGE